MARRQIADPGDVINTRQVDLPAILKAEIGSRAVTVACRATVRPLTS